MEVEFRHLEQLVLDIYQPAVEEMIFAGWKVPALCLINNMINSKDVKATIWDDVCVAVSGIALQADSDIVMPWAIFANAAFAKPKRFWAESSAQVREWIANYPRQQGFISANNEASVRWLSRAGYTIGEPRDLTNATGDTLLVRSFSYGSI